MLVQLMHIMMLMYHDADAVTSECYTCRSVPTSLGCSFSDFEWDLKEDIQCGDILGEGKER